MGNPQMFDRLVEFAEPGGQVIDLGAGLQRWTVPG